MTSRGSSGSGGVKFFDMLGILFIGLKLAGCIDWSWWVVLSPIWGPLVLLIAVYVIAEIVEKS